MLKLLKIYLYISIFLGTLYLAVQPFYAFYLYKVYYAESLKDSVSYIKDMIMSVIKEGFISGSLTSLSTILFHLIILGIVNIYISIKKGEIEISAG